MLGLTWLLENDKTKDGREMTRASAHFYMDRIWKTAAALFDHVEEHTAPYVGRSCSQPA